MSRKLYIWKMKFSFLWNDLKKIGGNVLIGLYFAVLGIAGAFFLVLSLAAGVLGAFRFPWVILGVAALFFAIGEWGKGKNFWGKFRSFCFMIFCSGGITGLIWMVGGKEPVPAYFNARFSSLENFQNGIADSPAAGLVLPLMAIGGIEGLLLLYKKYIKGRFGK